MGGGVGGGGGQEQEQQRRQQRLRELNSKRVAVTACPVYKNRTEDFFLRQVRRQKLK